MRRLIWLAIPGLLLFAGCGGSDSATPVDTGGDGGIDGGGTGGDDALRGPGSAHFAVDVATGEVTVTPIAGSRAAFSGGSVSFASGTLLDEAGDTGLRAVDVRLENHWNVPIGEQPGGTDNGLRVILGAITNTASPSVDLRTLTTVETIAGTGSAGTSDGPALAAGLNQPAGVAVAEDGTVFVVEYAGHRLRQIADGRMTTLAGSTTAGYADGLGTAARFNYPTSAAVDPADGAVYVADYRTIRRITRDGRVTTIAGTGAAGGADGAGNVATFGRPYGIAAGPGHVVYVTETAHRVRCLRLVGADPAVAGDWVVTTVAGNGSAGDADGVGAAAQFNGPAGICFGGDGDLYVADTNNHRVRRVTTDGRVATIAGTGVAGSSSGVGSSARFNAPYGIVAVGRALYVTDRDGQRVRQLRLLTENAAPSSASSWLVSTIAGNGGGDIDGAGNVARFAQPRQLAASSGGTLVLADIDNHKVKQIRALNGFFPLGNPAGGSSSEAVRVSNADGYVEQTELGSNLPYFLYPGALDPGEASDEKRWTFLVPAGVTAFEFRVQVDAPTSVVAPPGAADGTANGGVGSPDVLVETLSGELHYSTFIVDGPLGTARFGAVTGLASDAAGNVFFSQFWLDAVRKVGIDGFVRRIAGGYNGSSNGSGNGTQFNIASGLDVSSDGREVFVADQQNELIRRLALTGSDPNNPADWTSYTIAGSAGVSGYANGPGQDARFNKPSDVAVDGAGNVYVSEADGRRVRVITRIGSPTIASGWYVSAVAGDFSVETPATGSTDGPSNSARFGIIGSIDLAPDGTIVVADISNDRIRRIVPSSEGYGYTVDTLAGSTSGYQDGLGTAARFSSPYDLDTDSAGYVYVADQSNNRVRRVSPAGQVTTVAGTGASGGVDGRGNVAQFAYPSAICVDPSGTIYVIDANTHRLRVIHRVVDGG